MIRVADRSRNSNKMTPLPNAITYSNCFWHQELFLQNRSRELFFSNTVALMFVKLKGNLKELALSRYFGMKILSYGKKAKILMFGRYL